MKCPVCGMEIANDSLFCECCGAPITKQKSKKTLWILLCLLISIVLGGGGTVLFLFGNNKISVKEYSLDNAIDSVNYALGFSNGVSVKKYYLANDNSEDAINDFLIALDNGYHKRERQNWKLKSKTQYPQLVELANNMGDAISRQANGLMDMSGVETDFNRIQMGFYDGLHNNIEIFTEKTAGNFIEAFINNFHYGDAKAKGDEFLKKNAKRKGVSTTKSGLQYEVLCKGNGSKPSATSTVKVHYEGTLIDGTVFDSSYQRGEPIEFKLNSVIKGWREGLQLMPEGAKYKLYIPYKLGYGEKGAAGSIPPYSVLIFTIELLEVK